MGERLLCKQEVIGSNPFTSTTGKAAAPVTGARRSEKIERHDRGRVRWG